MTAPPAEPPPHWAAYDEAEGLEPWFLQGLLRHHGGWQWRWRNGSWVPDHPTAVQESSVPIPPEYDERTEP